MISKHRVYWDNEGGCYTFDPPSEGSLVCAAGGAVPREHWETLTDWLAKEQKKAVKNEKAESKAIKPGEDK